MPVPTAPTTAVAGQPTRASLQFNALAAQVAWLLSPPLCIMKQTVAQAALVTGTFNDVLWDTEEIDRDGGHSTVTNTNRYTAVTAGWYEVATSILWTSNTAGLRLLRLGVNGTTFYRISDAPSATVSGSATSSGVGSVFLNVGDYVTVQARQDSGGNLQFSVADNAPRVSIRWISQ